MSGSQFGIIGLGTMGRNLALNIESRGYRVAVWNLEPEWVEAISSTSIQGTAFEGTTTFEAFTAALERPRRIMMMIPAGKPVDATIQKLLPLLDRGDVVIDGGNSWFEDTRRREAELRPAGIHFVGCGVSGGEEGARLRSVAHARRAERGVAHRRATCSKPSPRKPRPARASRTSGPTAPATS